MTKKVKIVGAENEDKKFHFYQVKTKGKHPVHIIEGGAIITEDESHSYNPQSDCGIYWLNQKEYNYFRSKLKEIVVEVI